MSSPRTRKTAPVMKATGNPQVDLAYAEFVKAYPRARPVDKGYWVDPPNPQRDMDLEQFAQLLDVVLGMPSTFEEGDAKPVDLTWTWNLPGARLYVWEEQEDDDWIYGISYL